MKIVDVCAFYSPRGGGVKTYIEQKLAIALKLGHEITVIAPGDEDRTVEFGPASRLVTLRSPHFPLDRKYWYFADEAALHAAIDAEAPDFLEASSPWRSASMVARWPGSAPRALIMHADPLSAYAYRWFEPLFSRTSVDRGFERFWAHLRTLGRAYDRVVCANRELRDRLAQGGVNNAILHPMGVDGDLFHPGRADPALRRELLAACALPEDAHLLLGVGRLSPEKRWSMIADAVVAASQFKPIGLVLLGEGRQRNHFLRDIRGNPHIRLLAPVRDRTKYASILASADALVHGCEAETFCMAAAEARASGVPVIVPDRGGAADHARDGGGLTYRAGSALSAAETIIAALRQPWRRPSPATYPVVTTQQYFARLFSEYAGLAQRTVNAA